MNEKIDFRCCSLRAVAPFLFIIDQLTVRVIKYRNILPSSTEESHHELASRKIDEIPYMVAFGRFCAEAEVVIKADWGCADGSELIMSGLHLSQHKF